MLGNKEKHEAMWQHLIDSVDDIFELYADTKDEDEDPEWILIDKKSDFIGTHYGDRFVLHQCYACNQCEGECRKCPIILKAGCCKEGDSAFSMALKAIEEQDRDKFIKEAGRLKDAWE